MCVLEAAHPRLVVLREGLRQCRQVGGVVARVLGQGGRVAEPARRRLEGARLLQLQLREERRGERVGAALHEPPVFSL